MERKIVSNEFQWIGWHSNVNQVGLVYTIFAVDLSWSFNLNQSCGSLNCPWNHELCAGTVRREKIRRCFFTTFATKLSFLPRQFVYKKIFFVYYVSKEWCMSREISVINYHSYNDLIYNMFLMTWWYVAKIFSLYNIWQYLSHQSGQKRAVYNFYPYKTVYV